MPANQAGDPPELQPSRNRKDCPGNQNPHGMLYHTLRAHSSAPEAIETTNARKILDATPGSRRRWRPSQRLSDGCAERPFHHQSWIHQREYLPKPSHPCGWFGPMAAGLVSRGRMIDDGETFCVGLTADDPAEFHDHLMS